jgi:endonuclease YncB( thermonuclease family)
MSSLSYLRLTLFLLLSSCGATAPAYAQGSVVGYAYVVDGDTLYINNIRVRLFGIDAPEHSQTCTDKYGHAYACGVKATNSLKSLVNYKVVSCYKVTSDVYGRVVANCYADGKNVNAVQVDRGWAVATVHFSRRYERNMTYAEENNRGIFQGKFEMPYKWRYKHSSR